MKKWTAEHGNCRYTIEETADRTFDLTVDVLGQKTYHWFPSYASARNYLRNEEAFTGRMKQVKEGTE